MIMMYAGLRRGISIHVPRMRDDLRESEKCYSTHISIHVPRMRDDFLIRGEDMATKDFNPRPSHEGRQHRHSTLKLSAHISIHVPRMRDDFDNAVPPG